MRYCIAVDSGGTKTDLVLFDLSGRVIARHRGPGCNGMDIGKEEALQRMVTMIRNIASLSPSPISSFYGGIAGILPLGDYMSEEIRSILPEAVINVEDDGPELISGTIGHKDGCGMVCGTGSSLFIRREGKPLEKIGGKGYLIDTGGSGFELGRDAICMAFRSLEGRCGHTALQELVGKEMKLPPEQWLKAIYDIKTGGRPFIARFSNTIFEGIAMGDKTSLQIAQKGAALLGDLTRAAERFFNGRFTVVMSGGIVFSHPEYAQMIKEASSPEADLILATAAPIYGAMVGALWNLGLEADEAFHSRFLAQAQWQKTGVSDSEET